jgi:hypothetical protein
MSDEQQATQGAQQQPQQTQPPSQTTPPTPTPEPIPTEKAETSTPSTSEPKSLLNKEPSKGAPEAYTEFKAPEGFQLDADVIKEAAPMFKDMGLSQEQAQRLVDFYVKTNQETLNQPYEAYKAMREEWVEQAKKHPEIGGNLDRVLTTVSRAIDSVGDATLAREFRQVMDMTGAGDHPSFIRMFYKLASMVTEGRPVMGNGPSRASQQDPNRGRPASAAAALYPNLPSGA